MDEFRSLWEAREFDFAAACREIGRNNAFWVLCYRRHLDGVDLPRKTELNRLVRVAQQATAGLDTDGREERFTRYEARATVDQVSSYPSAGLRPMAARLRHWARTTRSRRATHPVRRLALAMADLSERAGRHDFTASTRQLAELAQMSHVAVSRHMHVLVDAGLVTRRGYCKSRVYDRGTSKFTIAPQRPAQRLDEVEAPRYDKLRARWTWRRPELRGTLTQWAFSRGAASVPNVTTLPTSSSSSTSIPTASAFSTGMQTLDSRGSP
jgi:DNA-binding transcriptional ArsR family regulator